MTSPSSANTANTPDPTSSHDEGRWKVLVALFLFAIAVRLLAARGNIANIADRDEREHYDIAESMVRGFGYSIVPQQSADGLSVASAYRAPGGAIMLALSMAIFGIKPLVARLTAVVFSSLSAPLMYAFARTALTRPLAIVSAVLCAVWPTWVFYSSAMLSEPFFVPSLLWVLLSVTLAFEEKTVWAAVRLGVALAVTTLIKPAGFPLLLLIVLYLLFRLRSFGMATWLRVPGVAVVLFVVLYSPWVIRNEVVFHRFIPFATEGGETLLGSNNPHVVEDRSKWGMWVWPGVYPEYFDMLKDVHDDYERSKIQNATAMTYLTSHPDVIPELVYHKERNFLWPVTGKGGATRIAVLASYGTLLGLMLVRFALMLRRRGPPSSPALHASTLWLITAVGLAGLYWGALTRGRLPLEIVFIPWGVEMAAHLFSRRVAREA